MEHSKLQGSGDCVLMNLVWKLIWNPSSELYLPRVIKQGLKDSTFGIDIPPFDTVNIGDLPEITMFKEPVLGYMKLYLTSSQLSGLGTVSKGTLSCDDTNPDKTIFTITLPFGRLEFSGKYGVSAGGGIGGCAIAAGAAILGGDAMSGTGVSLLALPGDDPADQNIEQSLWYRQPLSKHENGQLLIGAYYQNNPAIYDLVNEPGSLLAKSMKLADVHSTTQQVNSATSYYYNQQNAKQEQQGPAPEIGTPDQYASGGLPSAYALAMANQKVKNGKDPDGRYARLAQHIIHFTGSISYYQKQYPGTQPVGGSGGVLDNIAKTDPDQVHAYVMKNGPYPVIDLQTSEIVDYIEPQPLDREELRRAYAVKAATWNRLESSDKVDGSFTDAGIQIYITVSGNLSAGTNGDVVCSITEISTEIGDLHITLSQEKGWWPGLYDKVTNWIANSGFLKNIIKEKLRGQLNSDDMKKNLAQVVNGALKKI